VEWLKRLYRQIVGLDTAPLIYFIEKHQTYLPLVRPFFEAGERGDIQVVTSTLTLTEVLIHPLRQGNQDLAREYSRILLSATNLRMVSVSPLVASEAARIRAGSGIGTPDAIQLTTAQQAKATFFLTNDEGLAGIPGLRVVVLKGLLKQA
jgi:predicted nucleic acid-binding protein